MRRAKSHGRGRYRRNEERRKRSRMAEVGVDVRRVEACNGCAGVRYGDRRVRGGKAEGGSRDY